MPSRIAVLAVLEPVDGHLAVADIHQRILDGVPDGSPGPDLATVYRTVTTLVDQGVLHALAVDGGLTTYGLAEKPHHHAVCTQCGTIIEVPATQLSTALAHAIEGSSFTLSERAGLTLHGLCPQCQKAEGQITEGQKAEGRTAEGPTEDRQTTRCSARWNIWPFVRDY